METDVLQWPSFKVDNTMIKGYDFLLEVIRDLVDRRTNGESLDDSLYMKWARPKIRSGSWHYGCKTETDIVERRRRILELYDYIKVNGYNPVAALDWDRRYNQVTFPISVRFDQDGYIYVCDGFHRMVILHLLGIKVKVDCVITNSPLALDTERTGFTKGDFPLDQLLKEVNSGENLYQPNKDPRCINWTLWRQDCESRLKLIRSRLPEKKKTDHPSLLDIGSSEGWFSRAFSKAGYTVTGLDTDARRIAISRYLAIKDSLDIRWETGDWLNFIKRTTPFDTIIMLSVWHHDIIANGLFEAIEHLKVFRGSCKRLIIETPLDSAHISWLKKEKPNADIWALHDPKQILEGATQMKVYHTAPDFIGRGMFFILEAK